MDGYKLSVCTLLCRRGAIRSVRISTAYLWTGKFANNLQLFPCWDEILVGAEAGVVTSLTAAGGETATI